MFDTLGSPGVTIRCSCRVLISVFIIGLISDLFVSYVDSLLGQKTLCEPKVSNFAEAKGEGFDPVTPPVKTPSNHLFLTVLML